MTLPPVTQTDPLTQDGEHSAVNTKGAIQIIPLGNSTDIVLENAPKPAIKTDLPHSQQRIARTDQLVYCNSLLLLNSLTAQEAETTLDKAEFEWLKDMQKDPMEAERLRLLVTQMVEAFLADAIKESTKVADVVTLGPVLQKEPFRKLLTSIIGAFDDARVLDVDLLQGLVQLLQSAFPGYIVSDDLVKILSILRVRLEGIHQQSTEHSYHLTLAVSRVLDLMADHKVQDLDRVLEHEPLSAVLSGLKGSSDPYLMYQACYAFQALQYVPDDETALQAVLRHSAGVTGGLIKMTAIFKLDLASILEGLGSLQESLGSAVGVGSTVYEGMSSLVASGQSVLDSLKEEFGSGQKRPWYAAVKAAYAFTLAGQLNDLQRLIYEAPCRCDPLFQWGICQLLGEIAVDPIWTSSTRQQAIHLLGHLYIHDQDWGRDESVRSWMLTVITKLGAFSDQVVSTAGHPILKDLERDQTTLIQHTYPLSTRLPLPVTSPLLAKVYNIPDVEYDLHKFRLQRLEESKLRVYIPPMAKASLQARDDDLFLLMDKVQEFLASDKQVMLILGDSGSGKSTFNTHLEHELLSTYTRGGPIPLFINLPAIDQPDHDMIEKQLATDNFSNDQILELKQHHQFVLICDGYDESQQKVNLHRTNMLNQSGQWKTKMIITCRSQYLGQDYRSQFMPQSSDHYAGPRPDLYQEAVIAPFSEDQIEEYVEQYVPLEPRTWTTEDYIDRLTTIPNLLDLVKNPFLLTLALAALPGVTEGKQDLSTIKITRVQLYDTFVDHWISVNKRRLEGMTLSVEDREILDQLLDADFVIMGTDYSTRLALAIFDKQNGNPVVQYVHLKDKNTWRAEFFGQDSQARLLRESSPLARTGRLFRFLHRSILEYFFSRAVFDPSSAVDNESEIVPQSVSASSSSSSGSALLDADGPLFKRNLLTEPSVIQFLSERVMQHPDFEKQLLAVVEKSKTDATAAVAAANAITILVRAGVRFNGADLRGIRVQGADLSNGQFDCAQFQGADLRNVNLTWSWLRRVILSGAKMEGVRFGELPQVAPHSSVNACAFTPDGKMLVLGEYNGCVEVLDTMTWASKHLLVGHEQQIWSVAVSPDSRRIVSASQDGNLRLWDSVNGGEALLVLEGHWSWVNSVRFSPCGKRIASGSHDKTVRVWDAETGESLLVLEGHSNYVWCVDYSPDGRQLVSGDDEGVIRFWDAETGEPGVGWDTEMGKIFRIAWSPNGHHIAFASAYDCDAHLWKALTGERISVLSGHTRNVMDLAFSPNGEHLVTASGDNSLRVWDASTGHLVSILTGHDGSVDACAFSPSNQRIASGGGYEELRLWDVVLIEPGIERYDHSDIIEGVLYSPDGQFLFTRGDRGVLRQWDVSTGMPGPIQVDIGLGLYAIAISLDGTLLALGGSGELGQHCLYLLSCQTGAVIRDWQEFSQPIRELAFSPCGRWLALISFDSSVRLLDLQNIDSPPRTLVELQGGGLDFPTGLLFSPSGLHLAVGFFDGNVCLYNTQTWSLSKTIRIDTLTHGGMSYSPDGRHLAVSTSSNSIYLWDLKSETPNVELDGHDNFPRSVAYSPCGRWILSGGDDKTVRLWKRQQQQSESEGDVGSWSCVYVLQGFMKKVSGVAWNPLGSLEFATGCTDSSVRIWRITDSVAGDGGDDVGDQGENSGVHVGLVWGTNLGQLVALDAVLSGVVGLDATSRTLLIQRGALDGSLTVAG